MSTNDQKTFVAVNKDGLFLDRFFVWRPHKTAEEGYAHSEEALVNQALMLDSPPAVVIPAKYDGPNDTTIILGEPVPYSALLKAEILSLRHELGVSMNMPLR